MRMHVFGRKLATILTAAGVVLSVLLLGLLLVSVISSGYHYMLDNDELSHAQVAYLLLQGKRPFMDFFTIYSPVFDWILTPLFVLKGFTFDAIFSARILMITLFFVRLSAGAGILFVLFGPMGALLFTALLLSDPLTTFSGMQIRPDNLMLAMVITGILLLIRSSRRRPLLISAGILLGTGAIVSMKILPVLIPVLTILILSDIIDRHPRRIVPLILGLGIPIGLYMGLFASTGSLFPMIRQSVLDPKLTNDALLYPVPFGNFLIPNNLYIYGVMGRPLTWMYAWILPCLGMCGACVTGVTLLMKQKREFRDSLQLGLLTGYVLYTVSLLLVNSVFSQYYLPVSFFSAWFAVSGLMNIFTLIPSARRFRALILVSMAFLLLPVGVSAYRNNLKRATFTGAEAYTRIQRIWSQIPADAPVFPGLLFRPMSIPFIYGYYLGDIPRSIRNRYPSPESILETQETPFVLLDEASLSVYDPAIRSYIDSRYTRVTPDLLMRGIPQTH